MISSLTISEPERSFFAWTVVLLVADLLHPVNDLAVQLFLDGDVSHRGGRRGAMPVLFARRTPDDVARPDDLDRATPALHEAAAGRHDQRLAQRVRVPIAARTGLERDVSAARARRSRRLEKRINAYRASEVFGRPSGGGL